MTVNGWGTGSGPRKTCTSWYPNCKDNPTFSDIRLSQTHYLCSFLPYHLTNPAAEFCHFWHCGRRRKNFALVARFPRYQTASSNDTRGLKLNVPKREVRSGEFSAMPKMGGERVKFLNGGIINSRALPNPRRQNRNKFHIIGR